MAYEFITLKELETKVNKDLPIMYDSETIGFYGKIRLAQFYQAHFDTIYIVEYPEAMELVAFLSKYKIVMHNAHYDITCIQEALGGIKWMPKDFEDTFLLSRLYYYTKEKFSLDMCIQYTIGFNPYENKKDMQNSDWSVPVLAEEQIQYAAKDVEYLQQVYDVVKECEEDISYKLDMLMTKNCLNFQTYGFPVDIEKLNAKYAKNQKEIAEIALPINCNSYQQVRPYINSNQSDDLALSLLALQGNVRAGNVRKVRKLTKENSFLTKFSTTCDENNLIYGKFKCSARSGRTTSNDQNLQQLPRKLKPIFGFPENGEEVLLYSDFAQIQLRGVCVVTGDKKLEELFRGGEDLHNFVAQMIFGKEFTKTQRQIAKTANFSLLFGSGVKVFQSVLIKDANIFLSEEECMKIKKKWIGLWQQVAAWQKDGIRAHKKGLAWETPLGRRYKARMMTDQLAMQIQGFEAEVAKLALHYMLPKLAKIDDSIKLRNFVHDSYIFSAKNDSEIFKPASEVIASCMQEAWFEACQAVKITDLPMPTNVRVGFNWGDIEYEDKFIYELNKK